MEGKIPDSLQVPQYFHLGQAAAILKGPCNTGNALRKRDSGKTGAAVETGTQRGKLFRKFYTFQSPTIPERFLAQRFNAIWYDNGVVRYCKSGK